LLASKFASQLLALTEQLAGRALPGTARARRPVTPGPSVRVGDSGGGCPSPRGGARGDSDGACRPRRPTASGQGRDGTAESGQAQMPTTPMMRAPASRASCKGGGGGESRWAGSLWAGGEVGEGGAAQARAWDGEALGSVAGPGQGACARGRWIHRAGGATGAGPIHGSSLCSSLQAGSRGADTPSYAGRTRACADPKRLRTCLAIRERAAQRGEGATGLCA
jgi:hypothetical protein